MHHGTGQKNKSAAPVFFDLQSTKSTKKLNSFLQRMDTDVVKIDDYKEQLKELFLTYHPELRISPQHIEREFTIFLKSRYKKKQKDQDGAWVYFPWNNHLVKVLSPDEFFRVRTSRNSNLITEDEQKTFKQSSIGIAGLSVGNSAALTIAIEGGAENCMRLADFDVLSLSNLNRIRSGVHQLGLQKTIITAQQIYEVNPYAKIELYSEGLNEKNLVSFVSKPHRLDLIIDEMDDIALKIRLRVLARQYHIPVISAADNGDNAIVDVERFDIEPKRNIFHGKISSANIGRMEDMKFEEKIHLINKMVGIEYLTSRMKQSLLQIGTELYSWPQLGGAASLSGAAVTYIARMILLGEKVMSGKYYVDITAPFKKNSQKLNKRQRENINVFITKQKLHFSKQL